MKKNKSGNACDRLCQLIMTIKYNNKNLKQKKMKKKNVLIVEDCKKQIQWLNQSIKKNALDKIINLTIAETKDEFSCLDLDSFDIILTDLFLPENASKEPSHLIGLSIIEQLTKLVIENKISACGLVSNFEHHSDKMDKATKRDVFKKIKYIESFDKTNIIIIFDANWNSYKYFMSPSMKVFTKADIEQMGKEKIFYNGLTCAEVIAVNDHGYIYLKDYAGIIKQLLNNIEK